jgi:hypothetical protein
MQDCPGLNVIIFRSIAETAMWMMDRIMNNRLSQEFGQIFARIPLRVAPQIVNGDALEIEWASVLPASECSYVLGKPDRVSGRHKGAPKIESRPAY